jgi:hypothetical protein
MERRFVKGVEAVKAGNGLYEPPKLQLIEEPVELPLPGDDETHLKTEGHRRQIWFRGW